MPRVKDDKPACVLLGGSNSLVRHGLRYGFEKTTALVNLALGATSTSQNLYELVLNRELVAAADFVVTESNVNDSHAIKELNCPSDVVLGNVDRYYEILAQTNANVVVLIIPVRRLYTNVESAELIAEVNARHRENARRHGFLLVDLVEEWAGLSDAERGVIQPDERHPHHAIMHQLALNITAHVLARRPKAPVRAPAAAVPDAGFVALPVSRLAPGACERKITSLFTNDVVDVSLHPLTFPPDYWGMRLVAVESWCDRPAILQIDGSAPPIVKPLNGNRSFNELRTPHIISRATVVHSGPHLLRKLTERSILANKRPLDPAPARLSAFLLEDLRPPARRARSLAEAGWSAGGADLVPDINPYLTAHSFFSRTA